MTTSSSPTVCPQCGSPIPEGAPGGQCPRCLLGAVAATEPAPPPTGLLHWPTLEEVRAGFPDLDVEAEIGRGGMAVVYRARQIRLDRRVALKVLAPWLASQPDFSERFTREARTLARLNHPAIVTIHDFGETAGFYWLLMEYVDGVNLRQAMQAGRFAPAQALEIVPRICEALQYAHSQGVLHRDIKPDNILLDTTGQVKLADFGIAKLAGETDAALTLTQSGMHLGTPAYMAPEQVEKPGDVDHRADIYSLGVVFYEMLTGELPLGRFAAPSEKATIDARIDEIVFRTLEKERERRYQSAADVKTSVQSVGDLPPPPPPPIRGAAPTVAVAGEVELARKGLRSAIFTAGSLCLVILILLMGAVLLGPGRGGPGSSGARLTLLGLLLMGLPSLLALACAAVGMILGASTLGALRHSGGKKEGAGFATFAVLAWPVVGLLIAMGGLGAFLGETLFERRMAPTPGGMLNLATFLGCLIGGAWMAYAAVRATVRWARGEEAARGNPPAAPRSDAAALAGPAADARWSGLAIASAILTGFSLISAVGMTLLVGYFMTGVAHAGPVRGPRPAFGGIGPGEMLLFTVLGGMLPLIGGIVGIAGMSSIRGSQGRKKGAGLAVFGGMTWPSLMGGALVYTLLLLLFIAVSQAMPPAAAQFFMKFGVIVAMACGVAAVVWIVRKAYRWTTSAPAEGRGFPGWGIAVTAVLLLLMLAPAVLLASWVMVPTTVIEHRGNPTIHGGGPLPAFMNNSSVMLTESRGTSRLLNGKPELHCILSLNYQATIPPYHEIFMEIRRDRPDVAESTVETIDGSRLRAGDQGGAPVVTLHRFFEYEFPPGATNETLEEARRQINGEWLHRAVMVVPGQPQPVFTTKLGDGSTVSGSFILRPLQTVR